MDRSRAEEGHHSGELSNKRSRQDQGRESSIGVKKLREEDDTEGVQPQSSKGPLVPRDNTRKKDDNSEGPLVPRGSKAQVNDSSGGPIVPRAGVVKCDKCCEGPPVPRNNAASCDNCSEGSLVPQGNATTDSGGAGNEGGIGLGPEANVRGQGDWVGINPLEFPVVVRGSHTGAVFPFIKVDVLSHLLQGYDQEKATYLHNRGF